MNTRSPRTRPAYADGPRARNANPRLDPSEEEPQARRGRHDSARMCTGKCVSGSQGRFSTASVRPARKVVFPAQQRTPWCGRSSHRELAQRARPAPPWRRAQCIRHARRPMPGPACGSGGRPAHRQTFRPHIATLLRMTGQWSLCNRAQRYQQASVTSRAPPLPDGLAGLNRRRTKMLCTRLTSKSGHGGEPLVLRPPAQDVTDKWRARLRSAFAAPLAFGAAGRISPRRRAEAYKTA